MKSVFEYTDYRLFLGDYYAWNKRHTSGFSHKAFLAKAGFSGPNFLRDVIQGRKNLSPASVRKFVKAIGFKKREAHFFGYLVLYCQAKTAAQKQKAFNELCAYIEKSSSQKLRRDQLEYFSKWYHIAIREYLHAHPGKNNFEEMARRLNPAITPQQAEKAVALLERLELISLTSEGVYQLADNIIETGEDLKNLMVHNYHKAMLKNSVDLMDKTTPKDRYIRSLGASFSDEAFKAIKGELDAARKRILEIIDKDEGEKKVHHIGMQLLPLEKVRRKRRKSKNENA